MRAVAPAFEVIRGPTPLVLVAPHGGRRDPVRRPWGDGGLRTNDLHTAELTRELACATAGSALVNAEIDRNDVDLNRIATAHERAPRFLEALAELLDAALARHERAVVLTIHGWNVVQPSVDLGIGYRPGRHTIAAPPGPTASTEFIGGALVRLCTMLAARGIAVSLGARYPARGRENLLQLFSARHAADPRPLVRRLARLGARCDGVQLELGVPLRWPGPWRQRLVQTVVDALPALLARHRGGTLPAARPEPAAGTACTLEFVGPEVCGLAALDRAGGRLLLFEPDGTLGLFTGERVGGEPEGTVGGLALRAFADGRRTLRYDGPLARFPDTTPFVDLEAGLARATLTDASCVLDYAPAHPGCAFGSVTGQLTVAGRRRGVAGTGVADGDDGRTAGGWRAALAIGTDDRLLLRMGASAPAAGYRCHATTHVAVVAADRVPHAGDGDRLIVELATGERQVIDMVPGHRLPVVRGGSTPPVRVEFGVYSLRAATTPAGWCFTTLPATPGA